MVRASLARNGYLPQQLPQGTALVVYEAVVSALCASHGYLTAPEAEACNGGLTA